MAGIFFSCKNDIAEIKAITEDQDIPVQTIYEGEFYFTKKGKLNNKMVANKLDRYQKEETSLIKVSEGFTLYIYDSLENVNAQLKAEEGDFYETEQRLEARHDVELRNFKNEILNTEELIFLQDSDLVFTDKNVKITTEDGIIFGKGLVSNSSFSKWKINKITGDLFIEDDKLKPQDD